MFLYFSVLLALRLPRLWYRELILVLFVRLFELRLFGFVCFLFLFLSGMGCGLWLWHTLDFSLTFFTRDCFVLDSCSCWRSQFGTGNQGKTITITLHFWTQLTSGTSIGLETQTVTTPNLIFVARIMLSLHYRKISKNMIYSTNLEIIAYTNDWNRKLKALPFSYHFGKTVIQYANVLKFMMFVSIQGMQILLDKDQLVKGTFSSVFPVMSI